MKIVIHYCGSWGYEPKALGARARLQKLTDADVELVRSSGGVFDITVDGTLKFSKHALDRFPTDAEIHALVMGW